VGFFTADDGKGKGPGLWRTDGTEGGTYRVKDLTRGTARGFTEGFATLGNTTFFVADDGSGRKKLWATDGTFDGTFITCDWTVTANPVVFNSQLYFGAADAEHGAALWTLQAPSRPTSSISGFVFHDFSSPINVRGGNALPVVYDRALPKWQVFLDQDNDGQLDPAEPTTRTNSAGRYVFDHLLPGVHHVRVIVPAGWFCRTPIKYDVALDTVATRSFGVTLPAHIDGWLRPVAPGAVPLPASTVTGWIVYSDDHANGRLDPGEPFSRADETGYFRLEGVLPGTKWIKAVLPAGWNDDKPWDVLAARSGKSYTLQYKVRRKK
jgi:ELWxxDGT repeat protein